MTRKSSPKADKAEYQRFLETARAVGADESPGALDRAFKKIDPKKKPEPKKAS
jgi:hypothetical protein